MLGLLPRRIGTMAVLLLLVLAAAPTPDSRLERMRAWTGPGAGLAGHEAMADCTGPRGAYRTRIAFRASDGWARAAARD